MISDIEMDKWSGKRTYLEGLEQALLDQSNKGPYPETRDRIEAQNHRGCFHVDDKMRINTRSHFDWDEKWIIKRNSTEMLAWSRKRSSTWFLFSGLLPSAHSNPGVDYFLFEFRSDYGELPWCEKRTEAEGDRQVIFCSSPWVHPAPIFSLPTLPPYLAHT